MKGIKRALTLDRPETYQVKVPGQLVEGWEDWAAGMAITVEQEPGSQPVTVLTGKLDQAALQGLLRRLYAMGLPLISVTWIECGREEYEDL